MFVEGKSRTVFFPSDTLIYGISRDGSKNYNKRTCEHMILGQLRMGARQTNYAPLQDSMNDLGLFTPFLFLFLRLMQQTRKQIQSKRKGKKVKNQAKRTN